MSWWICKMSSNSSVTTKKRSNTNPVRELFSYNNILDESTCSVAGCAKKIRGNHAGNLEKHVKSCHRDAYNVLETEKQAAGQPSVKKKKETVLTGIKLSAPQILLSCLHLVTEHGRPFSLLDDSAFQDLLNPIVDALPACERFVVSSKSIRERIPAIASLVRDYISNEVKGKLISLKLDGTTKGRRSFIGINIQFIKEARVVVRTLAVRELFSRHTALYIKSELLSTLDSYSLHYSDVFTSTTDSGANVLKVGELLREEQMGDVDLEEMFPDYEDVLLQIVRCLAHTMQLAIIDALKDPKYVRLFDLLRKVAKHCRIPSLVRDFKKAGLPIPVLDVITRWGSSFDMAHSVRQVKSFLQDDDRKEDNDLLTDDEWKLVDEVLEALRPSREATRAIQGEQLLPGDFYAQWYRCKLRTAKVDSDLARAIVKNLEAREKPRINRSGEEKLPSLFEYPGFLAGLLLDPRYFSVLDVHQVEEAKVFLSNLWVRLQAKENLCTGTPAPAVKDGGSGSNDEDDSDSEFATYLRERSSEISRQTETPQRNILQLIDTYLKTTKMLPRKSNVLEFWESQRLLSPVLYKLAQTVLAIPLTQVSVERLFSALKFILDPLRNNLTPDIIAVIMVIYTNHTILEDPVLKTQIHELLRRSRNTSDSSIASSSFTESDREAVADDLLRSLETD